MGIGLVQEDKKEEEQPRIVQAIKTALEPVIIAQKTYYQTQPKKALELAFLALFGLLTAVCEVIGQLPWGWYAVFALFTIGYFYEYFTLKNIETSNQDKKEK